MKNPDSNGNCMCWIARRRDLPAEMPINAVVVAVDLSALSARSAVSAFAVGFGMIRAQDAAV
jgi:hypothetical protein